MTTPPESLHTYESSSFPASTREIWSRMLCDRGQPRSFDAKFGEAQLQLRRMTFAAHWTRGTQWETKSSTYGEP